MRELIETIEPQFETLEQQKSTDTLGMWTFLATEVLFFGGLFLAYAAYRVVYPDGFAAASQETNVALGSLNTALLLTSSLTMALAVDSSRRNAPFSRWLLMTALIGACFLAVKGIEYHEDFAKHLLPASPEFPVPGEARHGARMFFVLYWTMTALHALHLLIGIGVVSALSWRGRRTRGWNRPSTVECAGLYWHFVDAIWVFLYPMLYLIRRHG